MLVSKRIVIAVTIILSLTIQGFAKPEIDFFTVDDGNSSNFFVNIRLKNTLVDGDNDSNERLTRIERGIKVTLSYEFSLISTAAPRDTIYKFNIVSTLVETYTRDFIITMNSSLNEYRPDQPSPLWVGPNLADKKERLRKNFFEKTLSFPFSKNRLNPRETYFLRVKVNFVIKPNVIFFPYPGNFDFSEKSENNFRK